MTEDEWLDACADEPDDDLLRFAFADWLQERGDADRAEFIRLRVALSRQPEFQHDQAKEARADELLARHRRAWLEPLTELAKPDACKFPRGLPEWFSLVSAGLEDEAVARLAASPLLARLTALELRHNRIGVAEAEALACSCHLARLAVMGRWDNEIGEAGVPGDRGRVQEERALRGASILGIFSFEASP